jgi:hypothetical protein
MSDAWEPTKKLRPLHRRSSFAFSSRFVVSKNRTALTTQKKRGSVSMSAKVCVDAHVGNQHVGE